MTAPACASPRHRCRAKATVTVTRPLVGRRHSAAAAVTQIKGFALTASYLIRCAHPSGQPRAVTARRLGLLMGLGNRVAYTMCGRQKQKSKNIAAIAGKQKIPTVA